MMQKAFTRALIVAGVLIVSGQLKGAFAQSVVSATVYNNTSSAMTFSSPSGCVGTPMPGFQANLGASQNTFSSIQSPYPGNNGCSIRYSLASGGGQCTWVLSRIKTTLTNVWNYPTVNTGQSTLGSRCGYTIPSTDPSGASTVTLTFAP